MHSFVVGQLLRVVSFGKTNKEYLRTLLNFGLTVGVTVRVVRIAPLGCPVQIEVRGTSVALRKAEICHVEWEILACV